jgi:hypothetical protein
MHPDWLGSPQHFVGGFVLALATAIVARRFVDEWWLVAALAIGVTATAELVIEILEYPILYSDDPNVTAYYDTLADLADTLAGAIVGTGVVLFVTRGSGRSNRRGGFLGR